MSPLRQFEALELHLLGTTLLVVGWSPTGILSISRIEKTRPETNIT